MNSFGIFFNLNNLYFLEAHRALELLEEYHARLSRPEDRQLRQAIERVITIFKSRLFQALLGKLFSTFHYSSLLLFFFLFFITKKKLNFW